MGEACSLEQIRSTDKFLVRKHERYLRVKHRCRCESCITFL
jgi:hypothetical protein